MFSQKSREANMVSSESQRVKIRWKKRMEVAILRFEPAPQQFLQPKSAASDHWAMRPLHQN